MSDVIKLVPKEAVVERDDIDKMIYALKVAMRDLKQDIAEGRVPEGIIITFVQTGDNMIWPSWIVAGLNHLETLGAISMLNDAVQDCGLTDVQDRHPQFIGTEPDNDAEFAMNDDDTPPGAA